MESFKDLELVTAVDLNLKEMKVDNITKPVYHFIYASQLYGTLFSIYAKFDGSPIDAGKFFEINKISLKLLNYKGCINIGFTSHELQLDEKRENLFFQVRGTSTLIQKELDLKKTSPNKPFTVPKEVLPYRLVFNRILHPLPDFDGYLDEREENVSSQLSIEPPPSPLFDIEFNDRDGVDLYNHHLKPGMLRYVGKKEGDTSKEVQVAAGIRCNSSNVNLYF
jgi:hypothetical protein